MRLACHQPYYFPWLGYFHKIASVDIFAVMDDVQYTRREYFNRCKILVDGKPQWLTVSIKAGWKDMISSIKIYDIDWTIKHIKTMEMNYAKSEHGPEVMEMFKKLTYAPDLLVELTIPTIRYLADALDIKTKIVCESGIDYTPALKTQRIINVCKAVGADTYVAGSGGSKGYLDVDLLRANNIDVEWQSFEYKPYPQVGTESFVPGLSIVDVISALGLKDTKTYMVECGKTERAI